MSVSISDRWHTNKPRLLPGPDGVPVPVGPCKHSRGKKLLYPSAEHGKGDQWTVRWRNGEGKQCSLNRPKRGGMREETDPEIYAEALAAQLQHQLNTNPDYDPSAGEIPFRVYADQVIRDRTLDVSTRQRMSQRLALHVYPVIGDKTLKVLARRPSLIQGLIGQLQRRDSLRDSTVALVVTHVRTVLAVAVADELISRNPFQTSAVVVPPLVKTDPDAWPPEHVAAIRDALPDRYAAMVDAGAGLGMRRGEVLAFSPDDVDWLRGEVTVRHQIKVVKGPADPVTGKKPDVRVFALPKNRKVRTIELVEPVKLALAAHIRDFPPVKVTLPWGTPDGPPRELLLFFTTTLGTAVSCDTLGYFWRRGLFAAGIVNKPKKGERVDTSAFGFHALRRFFATVLLSAGEDVKDVSLALGHSSVQITMDRYWKYIPKKTSRMGAILGAALAVSADESARKVPSAASGAALTQVNGVMPG